VSRRPFDRHHHVTTVTTGELVYDLNSVTKQYQGADGTVLALDRLDLTIDTGAFLAVQGPTGGGKSTLLQMLGGLDHPTSGSVQLDGQDIAAMNDADLSRIRADAIGFVFQGFNLIPTLSAQENVEMGLVPLALSSSQRKMHAAEALAAVDLADRVTHLPSQLSGGQQQRVAIARALAKQPRVLLADEPTGNLDEGMRDDIVSLLSRTWLERGLTLVIVTHDSAVAAQAQRRVWLAAGRVSAGEATARRA
jgi:putative ABC transport system ATP-binding protein